MFKQFLCLFFCLVLNGYDITMILNGALGGLVAITAGPDLYDVYTPILIGAIGGTLVVFAVPIFDKFQSTEILKVWILFPMLNNRFITKIL